MLFLLNSQQVLGQSEMLARQQTGTHHSAVIGFIMSMQQNQTYYHRIAGMLNCDSTRYTGVHISISDRGLDRLVMGIPLRSSEGDGAKPTDAENSDDHMF